MTYLCVSFDPANQLQAVEVTDVGQCNAYLVDLAANSTLSHLSYEDANQVIGAVALLFSLAFILRAVIRFIQNRN